MIINWQRMGRMWPAEPSSQGRRQGLIFFFGLLFILFECPASKVSFQKILALINIGDPFYGNSSLWGLTSCHVLILPRKSNYIHGTFIHTHKVTPIQHRFLSTTHILSHLRTYSPLWCNEGRSGEHVATTPCLRGSPAIYSSAASVSRSTDLWFCAWCSCTFHGQAERKPSGRKKRSKAWLHSQKVDEKNVVCTRCNGIMSPRGGLTSAAAANVANRRVECTLCVFPSGIISQIDNEFD